MLLFFLACSQCSPGPVEGCEASAVKGDGWDEEMFVLQSYQAGKNSFVESTRRRRGAWMAAGDKLTLLEVEGVGSIRHIWSTEDIAEPQVELDFYVDGETSPSLRGTMADLVAAAGKLEGCPAPRCTVEHPADHRDLNLFAPIPFQKKIRVEAVQRTPTLSLFFAQIDYRLEDRHLEGACLRQKGDGAGLSLKYEGWAPGVRPTPTTDTLNFAKIQVLPGQTALLGELDGPGILRSLRLNAPLTAEVWLHLRYEDAKTEAFAAPLSDLFGRFDGGYLQKVDGVHGKIEIPMPFRKKLSVYLENRGLEVARVSGEADLQKTEAFGENWGWLHGYYQEGPKTDGAQPHPVVYLRGAGQWLGMMLYDTGHDHGGGDFVVLDGESENPSFLHGINGEDYFNFAWFGKGNHFPYAASRGPEFGRYRLHLENPYPFHRSLQVEWGTFPDLLPRSLAFWYQDVPEDTTVAPANPALLEVWDLFGPQTLKANVPAERMFSSLPTVASLDGGAVLPLSIPGEKFESGWVQQVAEGPSLNATYLARHHTKVRGEHALNGNGDLFLARKKFNAEQAQTLEAVLSFDDPLQVELNGVPIFEELRESAGFKSVVLQFPVHAGPNELVIRFLSRFNSTFNWAGFGLWLRDGGRAIRLSDLSPTSPG